MIGIKLGDHGDAVQIVQTLLNSYVVPPPKLREDGDFGPGMCAAVVKFQKAKDLEASGVVEWRTWLALGLTGVFNPMLALSSPYPWMRGAHGELLREPFARPLLTGYGQPAWLLSRHRRHPPEEFRRKYFGIAD